MAEAESTASALPVDAVVAGGVACLYNAQGALELRKRFRIVGALIGNQPLSRKRKQGGGTIGAGDSGRLPLLLMREELALALQRGGTLSLPMTRTPGWIRLVQYPPVANHNTHPKLETRQEECVRNVVVDFEDKTQTLELAKFAFPENERERLRFAIFTNLWDRGYWLTTGLKFGGDFLAYQEDPLQAHASHVVEVREWEQEVQAQVLIGSARLSRSAGKRHVIASVTPDADPRYFALDFCPDL